MAFLPGPAPAYPTVIARALVNQRAPLLEKQMAVPVARAPRSQRRELLVRV